MRGGNKPEAQGGPVSTLLNSFCTGARGNFPRHRTKPAAPGFKCFSGSSVFVGVLNASGGLHLTWAAPQTHGASPAAPVCVLPPAMGSRCSGETGPGAGGAVRAGGSTLLPPSSLAAARALLPSLRREGGGPGGSHTGIVVPGEGGRGCFPVSVCSVQRGFPPACSGFGLKSHSSSSGIREARNKGDSLNCAS